MSSTQQHEESGNPPENKSPSLAVGTSGASNWPLPRSVPDHIGVKDGNMEELPKLKLLENIPDNEKRDNHSESASTPSDCDDQALLLPH